MSERPAVGIIILNWRQREQTLNCLASVMRLDYPVDCLKVVLVDNASQDGSVDVVQADYPTVVVIENDENLGYVGGNNVGIRWVLGQGLDYILILNNDTILDSKMLGHLVTAMEEDSSIGIAGPMLFHADEPTVLQSAGGKLDHHWRTSHEGKNEPDIGQFFGIRSVDWLSGCALLVRTKAVLEVGLLDERFFSYWEDVDWCIRMRRLNWQIVNVSQAILWHQGVQRNYHPLPYVTYYMTRNKLLLLRKHKAPFRVWVNTITGMLRTLLSWSVKPKWRSMAEHRNIMLQGFKDFFSHRWGRIGQSR